MLHFAKYYRTDHSMQFFTAFFTRLNERSKRIRVLVSVKAKIPSPLQFNRASASPLVSLTAGFSRVSDVPTT